MEQGWRTPFSSRWLKPLPQRPPSCSTGNDWIRGQRVRNRPRHGVRTPPPATWNESASGLPQTPIDAIAMNTKFVIFCCGLLIGVGFRSLLDFKGGTSTWILPEHPLRLPEVVQIGGSVDDVLSKTLDLKVESTESTVPPVRLVLVGRPSYLRSETLTQNKEVSTASFLEAATAVGGTKTVWVANEIQIGDIEPRGADGKMTMVADQNLLYAALCLNDSDQLSPAVSELSGERQIELFDTVRKWGCNYSTMSEKPGWCVVEGDPYKLAAIRVEIASLFNQLLWKRQ